MASPDEREEAGGSFGELLKYTVIGYAGGLILGVVLDLLGFQRSGVGQWVIRTLSGESESLLEGLYALRRKISGSPGSMAEAYGWGKLLGIMVPWVIDGISRLAGVDIYGVQGFYIAYFYALSDQIGANISGMLYLYKQERSHRGALDAYIRHPVMVSGLIIIMAVPIALLGARLLGFSPTTQVYTALETILANLCWVPPMIGWFAERRRA